MRHMIAECVIEFEGWYKVGYYIEGNSIPKRILFSVGRAIKCLFEMISVDLKYKFKREDDFQ